MKSHSFLIWHAAGQPDGKWSLRATSGHCATCAAPISEGVPTKDLAGDAFSRQSDFLAFGDHVCAACGWMYSFPKDTHRNVVAAGDRVWWPMISADSATEDRPQWLAVLRLIAAMPPETPVAGVLTTDPKPRLWPMMQLATRSHFGLYCHCTDWDMSEFRTMDLDRLISTALHISALLTLGYNKSDCMFGLLRSKIAKKKPDDAIKRESVLKPMRALSEFVPALLVAHKGAT